VIVLAWAVPAACAGTIHVDDDAPPGGDGLTWNSAFTDLQDALDAATNGTQIRVAEGIYRPDRGSGDRTATFQLLGGVALYGGYAGFGAPDPDARDVNACTTTLSGDLGCDDGPDFTNIAENSYHVVTGSGTDPSAVLDGLTIEGGNADGYESSLGYGAGLYCWSGSPTLANCTIHRNWAADRGGGMYNQFGAPTLTACTFTGNRAAYGGGMRNHGGSPTLSRCVFLDNTSDYGGGMYNYSAAPTLNGCTFRRNWALFGGGMYNDDGSVTLVNCLFSGNEAASDGGGLWILNNGSSPAVINCTLRENHADGGGGGIWIIDFADDMTVANSILWGNHDSGGTDESAQITRQNGDPTYMSYCCLQGWTGDWGGVANAGDDPLFVDGDGPDQVPGTADDNLRLAAGSPYIDSADNQAVPLWVTTDLTDAPRFQDDPVTADSGSGAPPLVDRGAHEYDPADCNGNGLPDVQDLAGATSQDCNTNGTPDECDVSRLDCNTNGTPDDCEPDFDGDSTPDDCDPDMDGDGVPNTADLCNFTPPGQDVNPLGGPMGDLDDDCDVDLDDYFFFQVCLSLSGPGGNPGFQDCFDVFDFDHDADVDLADFAGFQRAPLH